MLSATHDRATVDAALAAGARGFVAKTADAREVLDAVRTAIAGSALSPPTSRPAPQRCWQRSLPACSASRSGSPTCCACWSQGKPNKLICRDLQLSEGTVKVHVSAILKALNVHSRSQAIVELARRGIGVDVGDRGS